MVNRNYHSLTDHLGSGREWDLVRKNGGLHIFPPYANNTAGSKPYTGRVSAIADEDTFPMIATMSAFNAGPFPQDFE